MTADELGEMQDKITRKKLSRGGAREGSARVQEEAADLDTYRVDQSATA